MKIKRFLLAMICVTFSLTAIFAQNRTAIEVRKNAVITSEYYITFYFDQIFSLDAIYADFSQLNIKSEQEAVEFFSADYETRRSFDVIYDKKLVKVNLIPSNEQEENWSLEEWAMDFKIKYGIRWNAKHKAPNL